MIKIVVITPGYISHYKPIATFLKECPFDKKDILIATNPELKDIIDEDGFNYTEFQAWKNSNPGKVDMEKQLEGEKKILVASYEATKGGMTTALRFQAQNRIHDLFDRLPEIEEDIQRIIHEYHPKIFVSVQLCYNVTAILEKLNVQYVTFVTGNPDQLPRPNEIYGYPHYLAENISYKKEQLDELLKCCQEVQIKASEQYEKLTGKREKNVFSVASSQMILYNFPAVLLKHRVALSNEYYLGSCCREIETNRALEEKLREMKKSGKKVVYVSFGTVFSIRGDVLKKIFLALAAMDCCVIVATGVLDKQYYKYLLPQWECAEFMPQILVLKYADLLIGHGGNNSITEALTKGVPVMVFPFASDQFFSAKAVEENGIGEVCDPQKISVEEIREKMKKAFECKRKVEVIRTFIEKKEDKKRAIQKICEMVED